MTQNSRDLMFFRFSSISKEAETGRRNVWKKEIGKMILTGTGIQLKGDQRLLLVICRPNFVLYSRKYRGECLHLVHIS